MIQVEVKPEDLAREEAAHDVFDKNRILRYAQQSASEGSDLQVENFCLFLGEVCNLIAKFGKLCYFAFSGKSTNRD